MRWLEKSGRATWASSHEETCLVQEQTGFPRLGGDEGHRNSTWRTVSAVLISGNIWANLSLPKLEETCARELQEYHPKMSRGANAAPAKGTWAARSILAWARPAPGTGQAADFPKQGEETAIPQPSFNLDFVWSESCFVIGVLMLLYFDKRKPWCCYTSAAIPLMSCFFPVLLNTYNSFAI